MMRANPKGLKAPASERGAVLVVALVMLLIITLISVASVREVTLEARVTGNMIENKRLSSAAESALREGERRVLNNAIPPDDCGIRPVGDVSLCITEIADDYDTDYSASNAYQGLDGNTTLDRNANWYLRDTGIISSPDPECFLTGKGCTNYYEVNSQARKGAGNDCGSDAFCIRSVVAAIFD